LAHSAHKSGWPWVSFTALVLLAVCGLIAACGSGKSTPPPPPLVITTATLTDGQVGVSYTATLAASGGTAPYTWSVAGGTLPAGLALNASTGAISGTPTAKADATLLTFAVTDSSSPVLKKTDALHLTISQAVPAVSISPARSAVVISQSLALTASAGDGKYGGMVCDRKRLLGLRLRNLLLLDHRDRRGSNIRSAGGARSVHGHGHQHG
jgi:hypothetical protein